MSNFNSEVARLDALRSANGSAWNAINPESAARMRLQNRFQTGLAQFFH